MAHDVLEAGVSGPTFGRRRMLGVAAGGGAALVAMRAAGGAGLRPATAAAAMPYAGPMFYNLADYGAIGDGFANDTAAVQAAVNAAGATGGGTILWPPDCLTNIQSCI